jgi:hypothetical protein
MGKFKFIDNLTGLEDKSLKWHWSVGPKIGMVFGCVDCPEDFIITNVIYKNNGDIEIDISIKAIYGEPLLTKDTASYFLRRREKLLRKTF